MNISLSSLTADPQGSVMLRNVRSEDPHTMERRISADAVLDGNGVAINDRGPVVGGQRWVLRWQDAGTRETVKRMVELYSEIRVCAGSRVFRAAPQSYRESGASSELTLILISQEA